MRGRLSRLREPTAVLLYVLCLWAPWERYLSDRRTGATWLAAAALLARTGWLSLAAATFTVTLAALGCAGVGAALGLWSTARGSSAPAPTHAWARCIFACAVSILMPPSGALVFLLSLAALESALARSRNASPQPPATWRSALLAEAFPVAFTACMAALLWRYNALLLLRCLLICYGAGLVLRAIAPVSAPGPAA